MAHRRTHTAKNDTKEKCKISTSSCEDENKGNPQDIKTMFTSILSELKDLKKQIKDFREEGKTLLT